MKIKGSVIKTPLIDIVVAVAGIGGAENCINILGKFLSQKGMRLRVVQMIYEGVNWTDKCMEFHHLYENRDDHDLKDFIDGYTAFLKTSEKPNLIIAIAWPMLSYVAKRTLKNIDENITVASWLHAPLKMYEASGYGGSDFIRYADIHFAISSEVASEIMKADPNAKIYRVHNPADLSKIHPIKNITPGNLLFVGRLSKEKNIGIILCAIAVAKTKWHINIVGDGDEKEELINLCRELNILDRVHFNGWDSDPWKYAEGSSALVLSSMYEGSPLVAIESLSCGLPVIANVSSRVHEIIIPGKTGYLYEDNNVEDLAKILDLISQEAFPKIDPNECRNSVSEYRNEISNFDFYVKIYSLINGRLLNDYLWNKTTAPIINDKISVVIPCYNVEKYLKRCLDSVFNQTIGLDRLEIVAVNDCSIDSTLDILKEYESHFTDTLCLIDCPENGGQSFARNTGLKYASGNYVFFLDSDDLIAPDMLEQMYLITKYFPCDVVSCGFTAFENEPPISENTSDIEYELTLTDDLTDRRTLFLENSLLHPAWGKLFKSAFLNENALKFPEGLRMEDIYFIYTAIASVSSWITITSIKPYYYFKNPEGTMRSPNIKDYYMDIFHVFSLTISEYKKRELFIPMIRELEFAYYKKVYKYITDYVYSEFSEPDEDNIKLIIEYMKENFPKMYENKYLETDEQKEVMTLLESHGNTQLKKTQDQSQDEKQDMLRNMSITIDGQNTTFDFSHTDNTSYVRDTLDYIKNYFLPQNGEYDISVNDGDNK